MTTTNHALVGAILATVVPIPGLAVLFAFVSHFVMDGLPHFGIQIVNGDVWARNSLRIFKIITRLDAALTIIALIVVPWVLSPQRNWLVTLGCMLAAISPDMVWVYRYSKEIKTRQLTPASWFSKFHKRIQWAERPWGWAIELAWFFVNIVILRSLIV